MAHQKQISVVKTAQTANVFKLVLDGLVVGSVVLIDGTTAELRNDRERLLGTYGNAETAIAEFEKSLELLETGLDL